MINNTTFCFKSQVLYKIKCREKHIPNKKHSVIQIYSDLIELILDWQPFFGQSYFEHKISFNLSIKIALNPAMERDSENHTPKLDIKLKNKGFLTLLPPAK